MARDKEPRALAVVRPKSEGRDLGEGLGMGLSVPVLETTKRQAMD